MSYTKVQSPKDVNTLVKVAHEIWTEYFGTMVDGDILGMIIDAVQSKQAIQSQIENGYDYYLIVERETVVGYFSYKINQNYTELFLSKVYFNFSSRGRGVGRKVLNHLEKICRGSNIKKISLTVFEKNLAAIRVYRKWGFIDQGVVRRDIDKGIVFNDIEMQKNVV